MKKLLTVWTYIFVVSWFCGGIINLDYRILYWNKLWPVKTVAQSSTTGHGTNVLQGLAISVRTAAVPALIIVAGILYTNELAGLWGL